MYAISKQVRTVVIPTAADGLSPAVNLDEDTLVGLQMPAAWTTAAISFQSSVDGVTFGNVFDSAGTEATIASGTALVDRFIPFTKDMVDTFRAIRHVKLRSGVAALAVQQGGARTIKLITRQID